MLARSMSSSVLLPFLPLHLLIAVVEAVVVVALLSVEVAEDFRASLAVAVVAHQLSVVAVVDSRVSHVVAPAVVAVDLMDRVVVHEVVLLELREDNRVHRLQMSTSPISLHFQHSHRRPKVGHTHLTERSV